MTSSGEIQALALRDVKTEPSSAWRMGCKKANLVWVTIKNILKVIFLKNYVFFFKFLLLSSEGLLKKSSCSAVFLPVNALYLKVYF